MQLMIWLFLRCVETEHKAITGGSMVANSIKRQSKYSQFVHMRLEKADLMY